jgi:preprotein translocase subunit SecA
MLKNFVKLVGGDPNKRAVEAYAEVVEAINQLEPAYEALSDDELVAKTSEFRSRLAEGETLDDILIDAFATVREVSKRTLGLRHYDVQLIGAIVLHQGKIAEMRTGEGKTLSATMPLYLNALEGRGVHLITVNDYLARRDARWMAPIFAFLGLSIGVLQTGQQTDGSQTGYMVDLEKESAHEDQHQLVAVERKNAYAADITYGTNNEFGFDYLRDNMKIRLSERAQREHHYTIIDEVDNVLIDEARTPLIISGPSHDDADNYIRMARVVKRLRPEDYEINEKDRTATLSEIGETHLEQLLGVALSDPERPEDVTPEQARLLGFVEQAMRAQFLFKRNKEYLVQAGKVVIIDEFTGRLMPGRRWSDGLHQAVEAKEGVKIESENVTYATITIQNYFRMYEKLAGMTGTALTEAEEFDNIYKLDVIAIPANVEFNAEREDATLVPIQDKDEYGYKYTYYAQTDDAEQLPYLWKRKDYPDMVYRTVEAKLRAMVLEILKIQVIGRPILVGTTSVERSDLLSKRLKADSIQRLLQTLLIRDVWLEKHDREEDGRMILELQGMVEPLEKLTTGELRQLAKDLDITLNLEEESNFGRLLDVLGLEDENGERLRQAIKGGVSHQVLNARKHTEESQIIAGAGAYGAVTIATNMAGRGVDIKLGGEIAEEILSAVSRVLRRAGHKDPFDLTIEERKEALLAMSTDDYGIYQSEISYFLQSVEDMAKVKELGGLHVVGSERHEARRIDNQLRGRAARQGDPGSSRFYLSLQDDLMRLFGGQQVETMMTRMGMDDSMPLEHGIVGRVIEQSQTRVEGANFDARKHLLEYDDVLNSQRATIYAQRDRIMGKKDLSDDVLEMLETEVQDRVPLSLDDEDGPWKLLAWLEQIQPSMILNGVLIPSFTYQLLMNHLLEQNFDESEKAQAALLEIASNSITAEEEHLLNSVENLLEVNESQIGLQTEQRLETLDTFMEGIELADETDTRTSTDLFNELQVALGLRLKMSKAEQQLLKDDPDAAADLIQENIESSLKQQSVTRLIGAVERRIENSLSLKANEIAAMDWNDIWEQILDAVKAEFASRKTKLIGESNGGQIAKDLQNQLKLGEAKPEPAQLLNALISMPQGSATSFDKKTHKQVSQNTRRLSYAYHAAHFLESLSAEEVTKQVLEHLQNAASAMRRVWGIGIWENIAKLSPKELNETTVEALETAMPGELNQSLNGNSLDSLNEEQQKAAIEQLGRYALSENYRQLLLRVISELWVDYLTRMEALRVSVRLEAYAQRDPLVEYKAQAFQMFQQLFADMRSSLVNRMFILQTGNLQQAAASPTANGAPSNGSPTVPEQVEAAPKAKKRRKRRRRKRK